MEHMKRYYAKEEQFLDEFEPCVNAAVAILGDDWQPDWHCDDRVRQNRKYFMETGELPGLVFDGAAVYHDENDRFSSVQITLKSPKRCVTVRVRKIGNELLAERLSDRPMDHPANTASQQEHP